MCNNILLLLLCLNNVLYKLIADKFITISLYQMSIRFCRDKNIFLPKVS